MRWSVVGLMIGLLVVLAAGPVAAQVRGDFSRAFGDDLTQSIERGDVDAVRRALTALDALDWIVAKLLGIKSVKTNNTDLI